MGDNGGAKPASAAIGEDKDTTLNTQAYKPVRILYPALTYPGVVTASDTIRILLMARAGDLSANDVAKFLRYAKWSSSNIHLRVVPPDRTEEHGGFKAGEITVEKLSLPSGGDDLVWPLSWANLSKFVGEFYEKCGYKHLYEVKVTPDPALPNAVYNLFWINQGGESAKNAPRSTELMFLQQNFVQDRAKGVGLFDPAISDDRYPSPPENEYLEEFGAEPGTPVEILHPLFVREKAETGWRLAELADPHICIRADVMGEIAKAKGITRYNNYNKNLRTGIDEAAKRCDALLMTGDVVDFGRGHDGKGALGADSSYLLDRNWFLLYHMLVENQTKPIFTLLGNHDWRLNAYPPASSVYDIAADLNLTMEETKTIHGPGAEDILYYEGPLAETFKKNPLLTSLESVKWYLLAINPFLDYIVKLPYGIVILVLDWAENERILKPDELAAAELPVAEHSLTDCQKSLFQGFLGWGETCKVVAMHPQVVGPYPKMSDDLMVDGLFKCPDCTDGTRKNGQECDCVTRAQTRIGDGPMKPSHPGKRILYASAEDDVVCDPNRAVYGSFEVSRNWFIEQCGKGYPNRPAVPLVLSGHAHRTAPMRVDAWGQMRGVKAFLVDPSVSDKRDDMGTPWGPIFVNAVCLGPLGDTNPTGEKVKVLPGWLEIGVDANGQIVEWDPKTVPPMQLLWQDPELQPGQIKVVFEKVKVLDDEDTFGSGELYFEGYMADKKTGRSDIYDADSGDTVELGTKRKDKWTLVMDVANRTDPIEVRFKGWDEEVFTDESLGEARFVLGPPSWGAGKSDTANSDTDNFILHYRVEGKLDG